MSININLALNMLGQNQPMKYLLFTLLTITQYACTPKPTTIGKLSSQFRAAGKKVVIVGDMNELENPVEEHSELGQWIAGLSIDEVIFCGELMETAHQSCSGSLHFSAIETLEKYVSKSEWRDTKILLKGSRSVKLEKLFPILEESQK